MGMTLKRDDSRSTDDWISPRWLLDRLGEFDLDPCACDPQPWPTVPPTSGELRAWRRRAERFNLVYHNMRRSSNSSSRGLKDI